MIVTVIEPRFYWPDFTLNCFPEIEQHIERCGRVCYKSEDLITLSSANKFVQKICRNRHESVLEHATLTAVIVCSRSASHQLVRHRIAAYSQESQRYCNYGLKGFQVICPPSIGVPVGEYGMYTVLRELNPLQMDWLSCVFTSCNTYLKMMEAGVKPEDARSVLPNATKTELAVTYNLRTWRHVIRERALNKHAQEEIRSIFLGIYEDLQVKLPAVFCDLQ